MASFTVIPLDLHVDIIIVVLKFSIVLKKFVYIRSGHLNKLREIYATFLDDPVQVSKWS